MGIKVSRSKSFSELSTEGYESFPLESREHDVLDFQRQFRIYAINYNQIKFICVQLNIGLKAFESHCILFCVCH